MMNVVLIHPCITVRTPETSLSEPLGLVSVATYLKRELGDDVNVTILDLYAMGAGNPRSEGEFFVKGINDAAQIRKELERIEPDLVGTTCCFTGYISDALDVLAKVKHSFPEVRTVIGGAHATLQTQRVLEENPFVDFVVCGEGELTMVDLVVAISSSKKSFSSIDGLAFRSPDGSIVINPTRDLIGDLSDLPIPDRGFIDMEYYSKSNAAMFGFVRKRPVATVMSSRGCPFDCIFCCTKNLWRRRWRARPLSTVFAEIEQLALDYGIREIILLDDQFLLKKDRVVEFCDHFIQKDLGIAFSNIAGLSSWLSEDEELLVKMKRAGFYKLTLPIESGNAPTLEFIRKPIDLNQVRSLVSKANRIGYWTGAFFIIGFPYETREQIEETIAFAYSTELDFAHFFIAQPYVGAELYDIFRKENLLTNQRATHIFGAWNDTLELTAAELSAIQQHASDEWLVHKLKFYLHPRHFFRSLLPKFRTIADVRYALSIFWMLLMSKIAVGR